MKKYLNLSLGYAVAALAAGVFYREFTKWNQFSGTTALGKLHGHLLLLGTVLFLLVALFSQTLALRDLRLFRVFLITYNIGLPLSAVMLLVRGVPQVLGLSLSRAADASISGIAGVGHILTGLGLICLLLALRKAAKE